MHVLQALQVLVDNVLLVNVFENVGADHGMQVCIHEVEHEVDITVILCANNILEADNVFVAHLLQKDDLAESTLRVSRVLEGVEVFLESDNLLCAFVDSLPDDTISSLSYRHINIQAMTAILTKMAKRNGRSNSNLTKAKISI